MKKQNLLFIALSMMLFSSCAFNRAPFTDYTTVTNVHLSQNNYKIIGNVYGFSKQIYIFGIGGMSKKALENNAIMELYEKASLEGSQTIVNISTLITTQTILGIYTCRRAIARGTVIEFIDGDADNVPLSKDYQKPITKQETDADINLNSGNPVSKNIEMEKLAKQDKNKFYMALLFKTKDFNKAKRPLFNMYFNFDEINAYANRYSKKDLLKKSMDYDKMFNIFEKGSL